ncbi:MAG TPA: hypothetical protein VNN12_02510 [Dehalococcoidia bacterium]|jgi:hypothetical protein|nr:hypothetical protein [Dehalococcoidia bacterium]
MTVRYGVVKAFDAGTYRAAVQIAGSDAAWLHETPVARNVPASEVFAGRRCAVLFLDETNPGDAVIIAVWA